MLPASFDVMSGVVVGNKRTWIKFKAISELLEAGSPLPEKNKDHLLSGNWNDHRECHIEPDWLLIYRVDEDEAILELVRMGSHSELFG